MSLVVVVNGHDGIVMAADTRLTVRHRNPAGGETSVSFDNATKVLSFGDEHPWVGAVTYGLADIAGRTAHSLIPEFVVGPEDRDYSVEEYASLLSTFFMARWQEAGWPLGIPPGGGMYFMVGGYNNDAPYGEVRYFNIPLSPTPTLFDPRFGIRWGGYRDVVDRIVQGFDQRLINTVQGHLGLTEQQASDLEAELQRQFGYRFPTGSLPLQDCVDLAIFLVRTTISAQALAATERVVGGTIEVATVTQHEGLQWVQGKEIHGEQRIG